MTYTFTRYFTAETLADLDVAIADLRRNAERRRPHIHEDAYSAMAARLDLLTGARDLLFEPVPPPFGG